MLLLVFTTDSIVCFFNTFVFGDYSPNSRDAQFPYHSQSGATHHSMIELPNFDRNAGTMFPVSGVVQLGLEPTSSQSQGGHLDTMPLSWLILPTLAQKDGVVSLVLS